MSRNLSRKSIVCGVTLLGCGSAAALEPDAQRGLTFVRTNCSQCHSIDKVSPSPLNIAPPFRTLHLRYPVEHLEEALAEGIMTGQPDYAGVQAPARSNRRRHRLFKIA